METNPGDGKGRMEDPVRVPRLLAVASLVECRGWGAPGDTHNE